MSRHKCSKELYQKFLSVTASRYSALSLSEVSPTELSHDGVSRWLEEAHCQPKEIWEKAKEKIISDGQSGILIVDDTVLNKNRSRKMSLVNWQYSGNVHDVIRGIGMVNLLWQTSKDDFCPMDFRIYHPLEDKKTKNDHLREMLSLAHQRGVTPEAVAFDCWYSSLDNLKSIRSHGWKWVAGLRKNRRVNKKTRLEDLQIPEEGLKVWLQGYGHINVFCFTAKNGRTDYFGTNIDIPTREQIKTLVKRRWSVEVFHRELKQNCGLENCQSRNGRAQRNHIVLSVLAWIQLTTRRSLENLTLYRQKWNTIKPAIKYQLALEMRN
jgi:hypothetical protein